MINILELRSAFGTGGGPEKTILLTPKYLDPSRYKVVIVYLRDERPLSVSTKEKDPACKYIEIIERSRLSFRTFRLLKKILQVEKISLIHAHDYKSDFWALILGKLFRVPMITTVHLWTDDDFKERIYTWFDRRMLRFFSHVVAVSKPLYEEVGQYGVHPENVTLIHNGIDSAFFSRSCQNISIQPKNVLIGYAGRLAPMKNLPLLLKAVASLKAKGIKCLLEIVGEGSEKEKLMEFSQEMGIASDVTWTGYLCDLRPFYERIDIFVLPSLREGLPNVLLEAMAYEIPCIVSNVGGNSDVVENGVSGILVDPKHLTELVDGLTSLIRNPQERRRLGQNARRRVKESFDIRKRFDKFEDVLEKVLARGSH